MGIIAKQTIWSNLYIYMGVVIGFFNSGILLPRYFTPEQKGLFDYFNSITTIIATVFSLGLPLVIIRLYPKYRHSRSSRKKLMQKIGSVTLFGITTGVSFFLVYYYFISDKSVEESLVWFFPVLACVSIVFKLIFQVLDSIFRMSMKSVIGAFLDNVVRKLFMLSALLLYIYSFSYSSSILLYTIGLIFPGVVLIVLYSFSRTEKPNDIDENESLSNKSFYNIALFGILGSIGNLLIMYIDQLMVKEMINLEANGIYTLGFYFGMLISIPSRGLKRISMAVVAESWKKNDMDEVRLIYSKSAINQFMIAAFVYIVLYFAADYVLQFMRPEYMAAKNIILIIGIAQLVDMAMGVNFEIISVSESYKYNTYFTTVLIVLVVGLNLILIPMLDMAGAAIASMLAMILVNIFRFIFLYRRYQIQPFSLQFFKALFIALIVFATLHFLPSFDNPWIGLSIYGSISAVIFWIPMYLFKVSIEMNALVDRLMGRKK